MVCFNTSQGRLKPGRMLLVDTQEKIFKADQALKDELAALRPVDQWLKEQVSFYYVLSRSKWHEASKSFDRRT